MELEEPGKAVGVAGLDGQDDVGPRIPEHDLAHAGAVTSYIHALKISPTSYDICYTLAETYLELGEWLSALEAFDKCIMLRQDDAKAIYEKAKVNFILSRTEEALQCLKRAFELDPSIQAKFTNDYPEIKSTKLFKKLLGEN